MKLLENDDQVLKWLDKGNWKNEVLFLKSSDEFYYISYVETPKKQIYSLSELVLYGKAEVITSGELEIGNTEFYTHFQYNYWEFNTISKEEFEKIKILFSLGENVMDYEEDKN